MCAQPFGMYQLSRRFLDLSSNDSEVTGRCSKGVCEDAATASVAVKNRDGIRNEKEHIVFDWHPATSCCTNGRSRHDGDAPRVVGQPHVRIAVTKELPCHPSPSHQTRGLRAEDAGRAKRNGRRLRSSSDKHCVSRQPIDPALLHQSQNQMDSVGRAAQVIVCSDRQVDYMRAHLD